MDSIRGLNYPNYETVIVDNGSMDGTQNLVRSNFPEVKLIQNKENLAFSGGNNVGIRNTNGKILFFLSNDVVIKNKELLNILVDVFKNNPKAGAISPMVCYYDKPNELQGPAPERIDINTGRVLPLYEDRTDVSKVKLQLEDVSFLNGSNLLIKREVFDKIGLWDEDCFLVEDKELFMRIIKNGFKILFVPTVKTYHKGSKTASKLGPKRQYYRHRNYILFLKKHMMPKGFYLSVLSFICRHFPLTLYYLVRDERGFKAASKAFEGTLNGLLTAMSTSRYKPNS